MLARLIALSLSTLPLFAQTMTVDFPDSVLTTPSGQYPIYTGGGTSVIRGQSFCPGTFTGLPTQPMVCTRVGVQLADVNGPATYAQFVVRVGTTTVPALTNTWNTNLPDQSIQVDLSNQTLTANSATNVWVEWPLNTPFLYTPGEGVVLDITSQAAVAGQYLRTAIGTGVARMVSTNYTGATTGSPSTSGGIKFRLVFEPGGFVVTSPGCPGSGNFVPAIDSIGQPTIGNSNFAVTLSDALGGTLLAILLGYPANVDIGGGCLVRCDGTVLLLMGANGSTPGTGTATFPFPIPNQAWLTGVVFDAQWAVFDPGSSSPSGIAMSSAAKMILH
ncbi:MAG: hypothetical protein H6838_04810 [Planctomycetes bacterium]|nr:hypothetical protein [Planctomycetota bacterium]MCB9884788.1 hypothetical protein [Planctomycetota bacterium]